MTARNHPIKKCLTCGALFRATTGKGVLCSITCRNIYFNPSLIPPILEKLNKARDDQILASKN